MALAGITELTTIDAGLMDPLGQAAHWNAESLGRSLENPLIQAEGNTFPLLTQRDPWLAHLGCLFITSLVFVFISSFDLSTK
jgi:hypothetical protein